MSKTGKDPAYIGTLLNATADDVEQGILAVEMWMAANSREMVEAHMNEQALISIAPLGRTLTGAQEAMRMVAPAIVSEDTGEVLREAQYEPDYDTRIKAAKATADIVQSVREKGPSVQVNTGSQVHVHAGSGRSFEERVREKRRELMADTTRSLPAAPTIDAVLDGSERVAGDEPADPMEAPDAADAAADAAAAAAHHDDLEDETLGMDEFESEDENEEPEKGSGEADGGGNTDLD